MRRPAHHDLASVGLNVVALECLKNQEKLLSKHGWALAGEFRPILSAGLEVEYEGHHIRRACFTRPAFRKPGWPDRAALILPLEHGRF
jgi:hypothetical protein